MMQSISQLSRLGFLTSIVLIMSLSGCLGTLDDIVDDTVIDDIVKIPFEDIELPTDWNNIIERTISSPYLVPFDSCSALESQLKQTILEEAKIQLIQAAEETYYRNWGWAEDDVAMAQEDGAVDEGAPAASGADSGSSQAKREEGEDYSGTNNQEQGVDEADFIKTDGYHIYILNNGKLTILGVPEYGQITFISEMEVDGNVREMMLGDNHLVLMSTISTWSLEEDDPLLDLVSQENSEFGFWWRTGSLTKMTVVDITNRSSPEISRELFVEGYYLTAREVDGTVRMINHGYMNVPGIKTWLQYSNDYWSLDYEDPQRKVLREESAWKAMMENEETMQNLSLADLVPQIYEKTSDGIQAHVMTDDECSDFITGEDSMSRGVTSILTLDLHSEDFAFSADHVITNWPTIYSSSEVLVITEQAQDWWWFWGNDDLDESTNIHTFDIGNEGATTYTGSGRINGTVLDQFCISEYQGRLRIASTTGQWNRWWMENPEPMVNHVYILEHGLDEAGHEAIVEVGHIGGIAEDERIWSARFVGDMAYIVTFRQIDPLWVIDLSNASNPTILGELEVPGVSTYIHPLGDGQLLTIGIGAANEDGTGLDWSNTQLSLFNASNATDPTLVDVLGLSPVSDSTDGWSWGYSEATYEHKAFQYWGPKELLAVPMTTYRYKYWYDSNGDYQWKYHWVSKLVIVNVSAGNNLTIHGEVDHSDFYTSGHYWWSSTGITRSIFMGDYIYAISHAGVTVTNLSTMNMTDSLVLDEAVEDDYYAYEEGSSTSSTDAEKEEE